MAPVIYLQHKQQIDDGYCLPACVQMLLDFHGKTRSQADIARMLGFRTGFGVAASRIARLRIRGVSAEYGVNGTLARIQTWLWQGIPVIAFVQAGELPHWKGHRAQHAVLLVGIDHQDIYLHDPAMSEGPTAAPIDDFLLAWQEMDNRYAVLKK